jgi:hypothetical protein
MAMSVRRVCDISISNAQSDSCSYSRWRGSAGKLRLRSVDFGPEAVCAASIVGGIKPTPLPLLKIGRAQQ